MILVTGGAGFIGSELVRQLADLGYQVVVVDNLVNGKRKNLEGLSSDSVRLVVADIRDTAEMARVMRGVQTIFHLACLGVRHSIHAPDETHEVNATATLGLLAAARVGGVKRFIYVSSSEVYGTARWAPMNEDHPTAPTTVYGASKLAGECYTRAFHRTYGFPTVVVRPFNTYGPRSHHEGDSGEVIPKFLLRCLVGWPMIIFGDGAQTRDFTFVGDTARGILKAGFCDGAVGETMNIGSGLEITIDKLAHHVAAIAGRPDAAIVHDVPRPGDVLRLCADITHAGRVLEYAPTVSLDEGLKRVRDWYLGLGQPLEKLLEQENVRNWEPESDRSASEARRFIPVAKPWLGAAEIDALRRPVRTAWVTQGTEVEAFETEFGGYVGTLHACAVSSCTAALHLALLAVGVRPADEVVTVSHSFIATANSIRHCGATPIFVDIEPGTFNMDPRLVEAAITRRTRAILSVHQMGMPCDLTTILAIARRHGLPVIEDAACALGSEIRWGEAWEKIGAPRGDIACFSFHPRKLLTTGDGGMLTTRDADLDRQFRLWRQHGMSLSDAARHRSSQVTFESYVTLGFNYRLTDLQAAMGRAQLRRLPEVVEWRRHLAERYRKLLADVPGIGLPEEPEWARSNWQSYCVRLPAGQDQRKVMQAMLDAGIATRRGIMCAHREPAYPRHVWSCGAAECDCAAGSCRRLAKSEQAQDGTLLLPLFHQMTEDDQDRVVAALVDACMA